MRCSRWNRHVNCRRERRVAYQMRDRSDCRLNHSGNFPANHDITPRRRKNSSRSVFLSHGTCRFGRVFFSSSPSSAFHRHYCLTRASSMAGCDDHRAVRACFSATLVAAGVNCKTVVTGKKDDEWFVQVESINPPVASWLPPNAKMRQMCNFMRSSYKTQ